MKFFAAILVVALIAVASAEEQAAVKPVQKLEPVNEASGESSVQRDKRGFILSAYTAPVAAAAVPAVEIAAPYAAAYTAPVAYSSAYTYSASLPYAYRAYAAPFYNSYPAVYV